MMLSVRVVSPVSGFGVLCMLIVVLGWLLVSVLDIAGAVVSQSALKQILGLLLKQLFSSIKLYNFAVSMKSWVSHFMVI